MPITASCWVGVVDKVVVAMSDVCEWLRGTPTSATSENENAAEIGREIEFLTVNGSFEPYQHLVST